MWETEFEYSVPSAVPTASRAHQQGKQPHKTNYLLNWGLKDVLMLAKDVRMGSNGEQAGYKAQYVQSNGLEGIWNILRSVNTVIAYGWVG